MKFELRISLIIACAVAMNAGTARATADAATDWNGIAVQTIVAGASTRPPPTIIFLDLAIVQAAVHDAVQAIDRRFEPYHVEIPGASGSPDAAVAKAAHDVLASIFPAQAASLDATYHDYLASHGLAEDDPGVAVGQQAAAGMLALRANDGRAPSPLPPPFTGGTDPGEWRPTPSFQPGPPATFSPMATPWLAGVPPFTLEESDQFLPQPPPPLDSKAYANEYAEVKALGARFGSDRTQEQTDLAHFYAGNNFIVWTRVARDVAIAQTDEVGDSARLLALASLAIADSLISTWDCKVTYTNWRPVTAIREADNDGNPETAADAAWEPLINTPNYPDPCSGANSITASLTRTLSLFLGRDRVTFQAFSQHPLAGPNNPRTYERFSDMPADVVEARILQGIHFRFADEDGRKIGRHVAQWVFENFLRPVGEH